MIAAVEPTAEQIDRMRRLRTEGVSWVNMAPIIGMSRYWCQAVGAKHGFGRPFSKQAPKPRTECAIRAAAGSAPLPPFHPIAMAELRRARGINLDE